MILVMMQEEMISQVHVAYLVKTGLKKDEQLEPFANLLPVIAVSFASNGDVKLHFVVLVVRLRLSQVPLDARPSQHHSAGGGGRGER